MIAQWLRQLGHSADVLEGGIAAAARLDVSRLPSAGRMPDEDFVYITIASLKDPTNQRLAPPGTQSRVSSHI